MPPHRNGASPNRVALLGHEADFHCIVLAHMGVSNACIERVTGLTPGQIYYRLKKAGAQQARMAWRNGEGALARKVFASVAKPAARITTQEVRLLEERTGA